MRVGTKPTAVDELLPIASPAYFVDGRGLYLELYDGIAEDDPNIRDLVGPILGPLPYIRSAGDELKIGPPAVACLGTKGGIYYAGVRYQKFAIYSQAAVDALDATARIRPFDPANN